MNRIEDDLKSALRRKPAPGGFAAKVYERIEGGSIRGHFPRRFRTNLYRKLAVAAAIILVVSAGILTYRHHITSRNEAALQRTLMALSIVSAQFDQAEKEAFESKRWERIGRQLADLAINKKN